MASALAFDVSLESPFDEAIDRVTEALAAEGFGILTRIDVHTTMKKKLDVEFRPYAILGACNPPLAHRALAHRPEVGLMLPCNVTVEARDDGGSLVRIGNPDAMLQVGELGEDATLAGVAEEARARLKRVADALGRI